MMYYTIQMAQGLGYRGTDIDVTFSREEAEQRRDDAAQWNRSADYIVIAEPVSGGTIYGVMARPLGELA